MMTRAIAILFKDGFIVFLCKFLNYDNMLPRDYIGYCVLNQLKIQNTVNIFNCLKSNGK